MKPNRSRFLLWILIVPFLAGCPDLSQVQQLAKIADGAKSSIAPIASDFKGSCDRQNLYVHLPPGPPPDPPPSKACTTGEDLDKLGKNLASEQNILLEYVDTLGTLAGTDASGFEKAAPSLDTSFKDSGFNKTQLSMAKSSGTLAAAITKLATAGYRKGKILQILKDADPSVTQLSTGLADQVASSNEVTCAGTHGDKTSYFELLCNEEELLKSYYEIPLAKDPNSAAGTLLNVQYHSALAQLETRKGAAIAYRKLMISIGVAHAKLLAGGQNGGFDKASVKKLAADMAQPIADISEAIMTLQKDAR